MCGRFYIKGVSLDGLEIFQRLFGIDIPMLESTTLLDDREFTPWNDIPVLFQDLGFFKLAPMFWNLVPAYAKEFRPPKTWFNTRKEKLDEPYQKNLLQSKRCVIPVSGFYENRTLSGRTVKQTRKINGKLVTKSESYRFYHKEQPLMALGGILDTWNGDGAGDRYSCSIITVEPNSLVGEVHDRMPFIIPNNGIRVWLDNNVDDPDFLLDLIQPYPVEKLERKQAWPPIEETRQGEIFKE